MSEFCPADADVDASGSGQGTQRSRQVRWGGCTAEPLLLEAKLSRAGTGVRRFLCGDSKEGKVESGCDYLHPLSSFSPLLFPLFFFLPTLSFHLLFLLRPPSLPSPKGAQFPPQTVTRTLSSSSLHPSVGRYRGGGVLPARWLGEKMGSSRPGIGSQRERGG